ncbi:tetratricopeptide repeat protein [Pseudomonas fakonensis]|uniref:Tetratricopeptide repeat protein n=1 Tax=Pseudomonas fakonensis TaxID=2842355 RepID=A0ABX8N774_9PSED|nr:tetratricopeptide repeat protein [Pseudomonas fakonensis]QXH51700.1 tetratricopeptide repeat protein [Pseudomonas fakonensis]
MISARPAVVLFGALLSCASLPAAYAAEAPLEGVAWEQADQAYRSYQLGRYSDALRQVDGALKLRPEVARLNLLKVYTLQKLGRRNEARQAAQSALKRGVRDPGLQAAVTNLQSAPAASSGGPAPSRAYQLGFPLATKAYAAYNAGDMPAAERDAERAFRTDPTQGAWALLWLDSLEAQQRWPDAAAAADTAVKLGAPNTSDLQARKQTLNRRMAVRPAEQAYQALIANRPGDAVPLAREAVRLAPDIASHRLLLVTVLLLDNQPAAAEQAANEALQDDDESTVLIVMRGYLRQYQGNAQAANADFDSALAQDWLDEDQLRNVRLIAIDAALAAGDKARASALLAPLDGADEAVARRQQAIADLRNPAATLNLANYPAPRQSCVDTPYGTQCELLPADAGGAAGPATEAYAAYARQDYQEAIRQARKASEQDPDNLEFQRLLTTALAAGDASQAAEAEQRLSDAIARTPSDAELLMQRGYLRMRTKQPERAREDFRAAADTGKAPKTIILDEAYALSAMGEKPAAVEKLKQAIDMDDAGKLDLDAQQRQNTRSAITGFDREWGATVTLSYRGARPTTTIANAGQSSAGDSVFSTAELYWRPSQFNDQNGVLEVYGRLSNTLWDEGGSFRSSGAVDPCTKQALDAGSVSDSQSVTGWPSTVGALGVRYVLSDTGFTFGLERRFLLGSATREGTANPGNSTDRCDFQRSTQRTGLNGSLMRYKLKDSAGGWLAYATYGFYRGTELRFDEPSWWTVDAYTQLGYSIEDNPAKWTLYATDAQGSRTDEVAQADGNLKREQVFLSNEIRMGRSIKLLPDLVLFPHVVGAADWLWQQDTATGLHGATGNSNFTNLMDGQISLTRDQSSWAMGVGPGIALRYWFREDHYHTPRSYLDWTAQYRFAVGGGASERAEGLFMNLTLSY